MIYLQYLSGRQTTAVPRPATASEFIEPTQGYDAHVSALPPFLSDPLQTQYDRSQVSDPIVCVTPLSVSDPLSMSDPIHVSDPFM